MEYRNFGRTGWRVSAISFGGWQLGGQWGDVDDEASIHGLLHAYENGVNFVDTAVYYGEGHSAEVIGESLRRWNDDKIYVATKSRPTVWPSPDEDDPLMPGRYPEWHLRSNAVPASTRRGAPRPFPAAWLVQGRSVQPRLAGDSQWVTCRGQDRQD